MLTSHTAYAGRVQTVAVVAGLWLMSLCLQGYAATCYVSLSGSHTEPYDTWEKAATNVQVAVAYACANFPTCDTVLVTDGTYSVTATAVISTNIRVQSVNGPETTFVRRGTTSNIRVFQITAEAPEALLAGFTISNGYTYTDYDGGAGVKMAGGMVSNCVIRNNAAKSGGNPTYGGGVFMSAGTLVQCIVASNDCSVYHSGYGGGVYLTGGLVDRCWITNNLCDGSGEGRPGYGGGVYLANGTVRNCVISGNPESGGVYMTNGVLENCTIAGNRGRDALWAGLYQSGGQARNLIVYGNQSGICWAQDRDYQAVVKTGGTLDFSIVETAVAGASNSTANPMFLNPMTQDYRLAPGSPALDMGTNDAWMSASLDVAGNPRIAGSCVDIGAYEMTPATGPLRAYFDAAPTVGDASLDVVFTASVDGSDTNPVSYTWNFGNGIVRSSGAEETNTYGPGLYTVILAVSNASLEGYVVTRTNLVRVTTPVTYVSPGGGNLLPYTNWAMAATSLQPAIDLASQSVLVTDGTYNVSTPVLIATSLTVRSVNGPSVTTIRRTANNVRVVEITSNAPSALLAGFTIRDGIPVRVWEGQPGGGGVKMAGGTVSNCVIRDNRPSSSGDSLYGGGIYMTTGLVTHCLIVSNNTHCYWGGRGGVIYMTGGRVQDCVVQSNRVSDPGWNAGLGGGIMIAGTGSVERCRLLSNQGHNGGGIYMTGGRVRNCLIAASPYGAGLVMTAGAVENCTIADNQAGAQTVNGISMSGGGVTNTIVYFNSGGSASVNKTGGSFDFSVAQEAVAGASNLVVDPQFVDRANGNYALAAGSPCIDSGTNLDWCAAGLDLDGNARLIGAAVDRGALENDPDNGPLAANFVAVPTLGHETQDVVFTASAVGSNKTGLTYSWDLGDGHTPSGSDKAVVTNTYTPGLYTVSLLVQNSGGETSYVVKANYVRITTALPTYFSSAGSATPPYTNWAAAATNIQEAIDQTTSAVYVMPGDYPLVSQVNVSKDITIRNASPGQPAIFRRAGSVPLLRLFSVSHSNAVLEGLTFADGYFNGTGGGVYMTDGTIQNCVFTNNYAAQEGGGLTMDNGLVQNCVFVRNSASSGHASGGALRMSGNSTVRNCLIVANYGDHRAGAIHLAGGTGVIDNCTIVGNRSSYSESCVYASVAGVYTARNLIVTNNVNNAGTHFSFNGSGISVSYSCAAPAYSGTGNISADPRFVNPGSGTPGTGFIPGDYHLQKDSPCLNAGTNLAWMAGIPDLDGRYRISSSRADMGCYEAKSPGTVFVLR